MKLYFNLLALYAFVPGTTAFSALDPLNPSYALGRASDGAAPPSRTGWVPMPKKVRVEGGNTRKSFQFADPTLEIVQVELVSNGRPLLATLDLWIGPDWTPATLKIRSENGSDRPVQTLIGTRNREASIDIFNVGPPEFPLDAAATYAPPSLVADRRSIIENIEGTYVEGGAIHSVPFAPGSGSQIRVMLHTDSMQLNARVELLNGPNNVKQDFEIFTNNGQLNSMYVVFNVNPGGTNTVRVRNLAPLEFPCRAFITSV